MPATVTLEEKGHILHIVLKDPLTVEEFFAMEQQATRWSDTSPYNLHTFVDVRDLRQLPEGFLKFRHAAGLTKMKSGHTVIVGASVYLQSAVQVLLTLTRNKSVRFFPDQKADEAMTYLQQIVAHEQSTSTV